MVANRTILAACLLAGVAGTLLGACSFDAGKLRAPAARGADGALETPAALGTDAADDHGDRTQSDSAQVETLDEADALADIASSLEVAKPDGALPSIDLSFANETPVPETGTAPGDGPPGSDEVGTGGSPDGNGTGGTGGGGVGGADTTDAGTGGGGIGGADAAGGSGGGGMGGVGFDGGDTDVAGFDGGGAGDTGAPGPDPDLVLWYKFDESSGTIAADSAMFGGVARNASLATAGTGASAVFSTAKCVGFERDRSHALDNVP